MKLLIPALTLIVFCELSVNALTPSPLPIGKATGIEVSGNLLLNDELSSLAASGNGTAANRFCDVVNKHILHTLPDFSIPEERIPTAISWQVYLETIHGKLTIVFLTTRLMRITNQNNESMWYQTDDRATTIPNEIGITGEAKDWIVTKNVPIKKSGRRKGSGEGRGRKRKGSGE